MSAGICGDSRLVITNGISSLLMVKEYLDHDLLTKVFKIETFNISSSALAAEICAGPHNRLLRRQHCSSLCSQSEGHEHVANMASAQRHDLVGFLAVFGRHNIRPPHFASKVSYSASPQTYAGVRTGPLAAMPHSLAICSKTSRNFSEF